MKTLKIELNTDNTSENKNNSEFIYALQEAIKQIENGYLEGDLRNEDIITGYFSIIEE